MSFWMMYSSCFGLVDLDQRAGVGGPLGRSVMLDITAAVSDPSMPSAARPCTLERHHGLRGRGS